MRGFENANVLVTGGAGFVGSNLVRNLLKLGVENITVVDNLLSSEKENLPYDPRIAFVESSMTEDHFLARLTDSFDYIFHLATYHGNQSSIHDPLADHENNTLTTLKMYERIKGFKRVKKVVYSSAGCSVAEKTFDVAKPTIETDTVSLTMDSPYSMSKIFGEFYSNYYFNQHGLPTVRARFQNVYGPGEILGAGLWRGTPATVWRNVIPTFIYKALKSLSLPLENHGIATRDFIYVEDVVTGLMACAVKGQPGQAYNLASGVETSVMDLALTINELTGNITPVKSLPRRAWDNSGKRFGSTERAKRELGFVSQVSLKEGLDLTIKWTNDNLDFIERCINKHSIWMTS